MKKEIGHLIRKLVHQTVIVQDLASHQMMSIYAPGFKDKKYLHNLRLLLSQTKESYMGMLDARDQ